MAKDNLVEKWISEGVSKDIITHQERFNLCPYCNQTFDTKTKPTLLKCGHFICSQCESISKNCAFPGCNKAAVPFIKQYNMYGNQNNIIINENSTFRFAIRTLNSLKFQQVTLKGYNKISDLLNNQKVKLFLARNGGQNKCLVNIGNKALDITKCKDSRIIDLKSQAGIRAFQESPITLNPILIKERFNGGNSSK